MNVLAWLEFELANYDVAVKHINLNAIETHPFVDWIKKLV